MVVIADLKDPSEWKLFDGIVFYQLGILRRRRRCSSL